MPLLTRRAMLIGAAPTAVLCCRGLRSQASGVHFSVAEFDKARIMAAAEEALAAPVLTITAVAAPGASDPHRFFCNATLDSAGIVGGYTGHADLLSRMAAKVAALAAAGRLTGDVKYFQRGSEQLKAWCLAPQTRMTPTLENENTSTVSQGETDLRRNSLRFTLAWAEFGRAASFVCASAGMPPVDAEAVRGWVNELLTWFSGAERAVVARESTRADAIFWAMQASELARFGRNDAVWRDCGHRFRDKLLRQLHLDGYFPYALTTERPYAESMLLVECMGSICESVSTPFESAWGFALPDGRGMRPAVAWAFPFLQSRGKWPYPADVRRFSQQPKRENVLLFAGRAWDRPEYVEEWKKMTPADGVDAELRREHPVTQPALWATRPPA